MILVDENAGSTATIDYVFRVLQAAYGEAWSRSLGKSPVADVMTVWANTMDGFVQSKSSRQAIRWALNNLPERCPNVIEFRNLCRQAPAADVPRLPEPKADPERVAAEIAKLAPLRAAAPGNPHGMQGWAHRLKERDIAGEPLNRNQRWSYQSVLGMNLEAA